MGKYIWLIGENLGATADNNGYFFWRGIVEKNDDIDKYFVLEKTRKNEAFVSKLPEKCRQFVVWKNSREHLRLFFWADMYFVVLSYRDIRPERLMGKRIGPSIQKPLVYLQHGPTAMKVLGYDGHSFHNNLFRFVYYNPSIPQKIIEKNGFRPYQLYYGEHQPRYVELIRRFRENRSEKKRILWFMTWREYLGDNPETELLVKNVRDVLSDDRLKEYLDRTDTELRLCVHSFFDKERMERLKGENASANIKIIHSSQADVMDEIAFCSLLITDYSSVGFDVTLLDRPVVLYQPDIESYLKKRELYCSVDELNKYNIISPEKLTQCIVSEDYGINPFFRSRMPERIDHDEILSGRFIDRMYEDFADVQRRKITFIGYNFYGIGGTVFATRSLAEGLLEKGRLVELLSLKKDQEAKNPPCGLNFTQLYVSNRKDPVNLFKRHFYRRKKLYSFLRFDKYRVRLKPYAGMKLTEILGRTNSETVVSTRESLHLFLNAADSPSIRNKIYFFHCPVDMMDDVFPGIIPELKKCDIKKAVFVTERNREALEEKFGYNNYDNYLVLGNCLEASRSVSRESVCAVEKKDVYRGVYLVRLSRDRAEDLENLIGYGKYLRDNDRHDIIIDVFGEGDYAEEFSEKLKAEGLTDCISYRGGAKDGPAEIRKHDAVVDFSLNHSFGMPYIEALMNGKMVYCQENPGSLDVLADIPEAIVHSYEELTQKLLSLPDISADTLREYYDTISERFSRSALADRFIGFIDGNNPQKHQ